MKIRTIEYRELQTHDYENETVGMTAELEEGDDPFVAMEGLRQAVKAELAKTRQQDQSASRYRSRTTSDIYELEREKNSLKYDVSQLTTEFDARVNQLAALRVVFERHGLEFIVPEAEKAVLDKDRYQPRRSGPSWLPVASSTTENILETNDSNSFNPESQPCEELVEEPFETVGYGGFDENADDVLDPHNPEDMRIAAQRIADEENPFKDE